MGVTRLKGRPRPWKVDYYAIVVELGRVVKKRKAKFFRTREQADEFWHRKSLEVDSYQAGLSNIIPVTLSTFVNEIKKSFFAYKSKTYQSSEKSRLARAVEWFGDREMHRITSAEIQARLFGMIDDDHSTKSCANMHGLLGVLFKQAKLRQHLEKNPMEDVPRPAVVPRRDIRALTEIELARVLKFQCDERDAILLFIHTGLRMGEMCRVRVERDVDFAANALHIRSVEGATTKNKKPRVVPLSPVARAIFERIKVGPVLKMTRWGFEKRLRAIGNHPDVKAQINAHRLRHTFCSLNMAAGVPARVVQDWLGHGSATITARYTHLAGLDQQWATLTVGADEGEKSQLQLSCNPVAKPLETRGNRGTLVARQLQPGGFCV